MGRSWREPCLKRLSVQMGNDTANLCADRNNTGKSNKIRFSFLKAGAGLKSLSGRREWNPYIDGEVDFSQGNDVLDRPPFSL